MTLTALAAQPRVTVRNRAELRPAGSCVVYWMQRTQRGHDNPALDLAIRVGNLIDKPIVALVTLELGPRANRRHYQFFVQGLAEVEDELRARGVGLVLRGAEQTIEGFCGEVDACMLVADENPLREAEAMRVRVGERVSVPFWTVDADVIVPTRLLGREHWAARTIRPHLQGQLAHFLVKERAPNARVRRMRKVHSLDLRRPLLDELAIGGRVSAVSSFVGGPEQARKVLGELVREKLTGYARLRNHPDIDATSRLSPYLHFGHIGPREVALAVRDAGAPAEDRGAFLEELIVRRELALNFVRYNPAYDRLDGCERWARETLRRHAKDPRRRVPSRLLIAAESPDPLWNAAQAQMLETGWMHGYLRMYWAKRLLEWTTSAEDAFELALALNDSYELDGSDPNGYAGVAWAIGGKHDRAFAERPVFGKVRYMSPASTAKKFDAESYIRRFAPPPSRALGSMQPELS